jgi:hypothetical protein
MSALLTRDFLVETMSQYLGEGETIGNVAYSFGNKASATSKKFLYVAFTEGRAILVKYGPGQTFDKVSWVPLEKFPKKAKWTKRWWGIRILPVEVPHVNTIAELTQYLLLKDEASQALKEGERLVTVALTRDGRSTSSNYYVVGFTEDRAFMLDLIAEGKTREYWSKPLSELEEYGLWYSDLLDPVETPLLASLHGVLYFKEKGGAEHKLNITNLFGQRQEDSPSGAGGGVFALVKAGQAFKFLVDQKKKSIGEQTTVIGRSVLELLDRLEGAQGEEAVALRWDIAKKMPNLIESLDERGNPLLDDIDDCRKQADQLISG